MKPSEVFALLITRTQVTLKFPSKAERELFRTALYRAKSDFDTQFMMADDGYEPQQLKFAKVGGESEHCLAHLTLIPRGSREFSIEIVDESQVGDEKISTNLG